MSKWEMVRLGDVATVITKGTTPTTIGYQFIDQGINFIKIESITDVGLFITNKFEHISNECNEKMKRSILYENDILFSIAGAIGRTAIVQSTILPANINQALAIIRMPKGIVDYRYLQLTLKSNFVIEQFQRQKQGVAQLNLSLKNISDLMIPLPALEAQNYIADTLDKTQEIIDCHKKQLEELDNLIKATFYDMFGDPFLNEKGWQSTSIECACTHIVDCPHSTPLHSKEVTKYPSIRTTEIRNGTIDWTSMKYVDEFEFSKRTKRIIPQENDIIYGREGSYGDAVILPRGYSFCLGQRVMLLRVDNAKYNFKYFWFLLRSEFVYNQAKQRNVGATVGHVNVGDIKQFIIPLPSLPLQNKFAQIVSNIESQKATVKQSITQSQNLFNSLMSKYFD